MTTLYNRCNYLSMVGFIFIHISKRGPWLYTSVLMNRFNLDPMVGAIVYRTPRFIHRSMSWPQCPLVAYGSGKRMVTGTRAGSRIKTRNFKQRFLPHHKSQRCNIWCTRGPIVSCFSPNFVDRSVSYEAKQRRVKFRRCFGNIPSEFR